MIKRVIFDVDYTLLKPNYNNESEFFKKYIPEDNEYFIYHMDEILKQYEMDFESYNKDYFLKYINQFSNVPLNEEFLENWFNFSSHLEEQDTSEAQEILEYLLPKYEIVVLTNWFREVQIKKLLQVDLLKYMKEIYTGDQYLKPYPESYLMAIGTHKPKECIMIGDNLEADVIGAIDSGLHAIHYTRGRELDHSYQKVKTLQELKQYL